jgi:hypothetical protein
MIPTELIKKETQIIQKEAKERTFGYILTALGLVAGLAWNKAIESSINLLIPGDANTLLAQFIYAIIITIAVVVIANYLTRYLKRESE